MADMIPKLREMAEAENLVGTQRGIVLVATQHIEQLQSQLTTAWALIKLKEKLCNAEIDSNRTVQEENKWLRDALENIGFLTTHCPGEQYRITLDEDSVDAINAITTQALKEKT